MRQRQSFRKNSGISKIPSFTIRRKSCECMDCGQVCKKLHYVESTSQTFQPYFQLKQKVQEQQKKVLQQKQLKMRDKRHHLLKKAMQVIKIKEIMQKKKPKPHKNHHHTMKLNTLPDHQAIVESTETPLPPRPPQLMRISPNQKRNNEKRCTTLHPLKRKQSNFGHFLTLPLDSYVEILIMKLITREYRAKFVQGSKDDFEFAIRMNKFQCENEIQELVPSIRNMQYLDPMPHHEQQEDMESSMNENEQNQISLVPKLKSPFNQKQHYREILKYNKRSLRNLVDQWQLCQSKTMKNLNQPLTHRLLSNNVSPLRKDFLSPNGSDINKKSLVKLPPIITTSRKYTDAQINTNQGNNYVGKGKHRKTQSQLIIKV